MKNITIILFENDLEIKSILIEYVKSLLIYRPNNHCFVGFL